MRWSSAVSAPPAAGDHARNFSLWGAMGGAVMIGLGLALAQPKLPVVVGDEWVGLGPGDIGPHVRFRGPLRDPLP